MKYTLYFGRIVVRVFLGVLLTGILVAPASSNSRMEAAPDFTLMNRSGEMVSLNDFRGQVVLINFWATWCAPCRKEMPFLEQIYQRYERLGVTLLGVNVEDGPEEAKAFLKETPVSFPVLFDMDKTVSSLYGVEAMPTTILVDRQGNVRFVHYGYQAGYENDYQDQIRTLVRERL